VWRGEPGRAHCGPDDRRASIDATVERQSQGPPQNLGATSSGVRHEILGRLAVGGMAELYTARAIRPDGSTEHVVLKRILPHLSSDPDFVRMFHDEAHLAATLRHPNIVRVHDIGQHAGDFFFTMEYVHGDNARTMIRAAQEAETHIPLQHVVQIGLGVATGLHYAHEKHDDAGNWLRIVHRDVSPTNILVSFQGDVKIVDFGIAKAAAATHVTQAGMLKGKASYMSPEQCRADPVDRRSDVYAIGILLYEMTTLTRLFRGDNELAILHQILTGKFDPPSTRVPGYPADLERIVVRCLAQSPDERYQTALEISEDLARFAQSHGLSPSATALGRYLLDLCGDKPYPWADDEGEAEVESAGDSATSPTSTGLFDEQDTKVNRPSEAKTPAPGPPGRDGEPSEDDDVDPRTEPVAAIATPVPSPTPRPSAATPGAEASARTSASTTTVPRAQSAPRPAVQAEAGGERSSTDRHRPVSARSTGSARIKPAPRPGAPASSSTGTRPPAAAARPIRASPSLRRPASEPSASAAGSESGASADADAKAALAAVPEAPPLRRPQGRGPGRQALPGPLTARQSSAVAPPGRTLPGVMPGKGTTLAGTPGPSQSRRTIPGGDATVVPGASPSAAALVASMRPVGLGGAPSASPARTLVPGATANATATVTAAAGSPARTMVPGATGAASVAATTVIPAPASSVETAAVPRVQAPAASPAADSGIDRTMLIPSPEAEVASRSATPRPTMLARTMHLDAGVSAEPIPRGPTSWASDGSGAAPVADASATGYVAAPASGSAPASQSGAEASQPDLFVTQRAAPSQPGLLVTQRSQAGQAPSLLQTQRSPSGAARAIAMTQRNPATGPGARLADLDGEPARRGTPIWIPMLIVLVVAGLAASAVWWVWGRGHVAKGTAGEPTSDAVVPSGEDGDAPAGDGEAEAAKVEGAEPVAEGDAKADAEGDANADAEVDANADAEGDAKADGGDDAKADDAKADDAKADDAKADDAKADDAKADDDAADAGDAGAAESGETPPEVTKPRSKSATKKPKKKREGGETPGPKPQLPGFGHGPVPP
jgi:serine/threonine protein kinase